jgi:hypothetical protein
MRRRIEGKCETPRQLQGVFKSLLVPLGRCPQPSRLSQRTHVVSVRCKRRFRGTRLARVPFPGRNRLHAVLVWGQRPTAADECHSHVEHGYGFGRGSAMGKRHGFRYATAACTVVCCVWMAVVCGRTAKSSHTRGRRSSRVFVVMPRRLHVPVLRMELNSCVACVCPQM